MISNFHLIYADETVGLRICTKFNRILDHYYTLRSTKNELSF